MKKAKKRKTDFERRLERALEIEKDYRIPPGSKMIALGELGFGPWAMTASERRRFKNHRDDWKKEVTGTPKDPKNPKNSRKRRPTSK